MPQQQKNGPTFCVSYLVFSHRLVQWRRPIINHFIFEFQYVQNVESEEYVQTQSKEDFDIFEPITTEDLEMSQILDDMAGMHSIYIMAVSSYHFFRLSWTG